MTYEKFRLDFRADRSAYVGFWQEHFPGWPMDKFDWFYLGNPAGPTIGCGVRTRDDSTLLGVAAAFPRELWVAGRPLAGGITGDFGVHPRHRVLGPALMLQKGIGAAAREGGVGALYGLPNKSSEAVQKRVGYAVAGRTTRMVKVLRSRTRLAKRLDIPLLTGLTAKIVDWGMRLVSPETFRSRASDARAVLLDRFDDRFDRLWERAKGTFPVIGKRDQAYLSWRFAECPYRDYRILALERAEDQELAGFVVFAEGDDGATIADMLAEDARSSERLLAEFVRHCRRGPAAAVTMVALENEATVAPFRRMRFRLQPGALRMVVQVDPEDPQAEILLDGANWYLTEGDIDV